MADWSFIEWDKDDVDALGILKVNLLALGMLTCILKCVDLLGAHQAVTSRLRPSRGKTRWSKTCYAKKIRLACFRWRAARR